IDKKKKRAYVYFVFEKEITVSKAENGNVISVDINESNVTVKVQNKVCILETDIKKITLGYASYKEAIQSVKGNGKAKRAVSNKEKQKKKDRRYKIANLIANTAKKLDAVVVLENLPKNCPRNMIKDVWDEKLRHRIHQAGFRSVLKAIEEKCLEKGVSFVKVNPKGTSSVCLNCGLKLMRGDAPRQLKCKCGFVAGRDVVAVLNLERTFKGLVPLGPMPDESTLEIAVLSMKEWMRRKSVDANDKKR
ncbi:MAG: putative transposase, partial [Archaeoglobaceae archaeon]|nr:putative transposase [Archaeoglobaceae archaeon]